MADKSLSDYANDARRQADEERGKKDFFQTPNNIEAHIRLLEWPGHVPCWIMGHVHFLKTAEGTKVMTCGDENCYSCGRLSEYSHSQNKQDLIFAKDTSRRLRINMFLIDMDNRSKGPQLWEPKNTQNCSTWTSLLALFTNQDDYGAKVYKFNEGRVISLTVAKEMRKMKTGQQEINIQKSLIPGARPFPIQIRPSADGHGYYQDPEGNYQIKYPMPDGRMVAFKLPDLGAQIPIYDENFHRECWGDAPAESAGEYVAAGEPEGGWEGQQAAGGDAPWEETDAGQVDAATGELMDEPEPSDGSQAAEEDWGAQAEPETGEDWGAAEPAADPPPAIPRPPASSRPPARPSAPPPAAAAAPPRRPPAPPASTSRPPARPSAPPPPPNRRGGVQPPPAARKPAGKK
jgi:hypothetical protein